MITAFELNDKVEYKDIRHWIPVWVPAEIVGVFRMDSDNYTGLEIKLYNGIVQIIWEPEIRVGLRHVRP